MSDNVVIVDVADEDGVPYLAGSPWLKSKSDSMGARMSREPLLGSVHDPESNPTFAARLPGHAHSDFQLYLPHLKLGWSSLRGSGG